MTTFTPLLTTTPSVPSTYNPSMADTFSWIPVDNEIRPLFAKSVFVVNGGTAYEGLAPAPGSYDTVVRTPATNPTNVTFYKGGVGGTVVASLTLTYNSGSIASVTNL